VTIVILTLFAAESRKIVREMAEIYSGAWYSDATWIRILGFYHLTVEIRTELDKGKGKQPLLMYQL
jgi:hypothetical protein